MRFGDGALRRAEKALHDGEFAEADKLFREVLAKDGKDLSARCGLSYSLYKQRKLDEAYEHAAIAVQLDQASARARAILGTIILAIGDFPRALTELRTAVSLNENTALAIAGIALIDFYENRPRESLNGLRRASFLSPDEPDFVFALGQIAARSERYKEAADAYERFLRVAPRTDSDRRDRIRGLIDFLRYLNIKNQLYVVSGVDQTSIAFRSPDSRPQLDVHINGSKKPLNFVLDTGSGMSVISEETAQKLGVKEVARGGQARGVGGPGRFEIVYGFVESIEIGDVKVENVPVYIRKFYSSSGVDGYLGLSVISKFAAVADYKTNTFTLQRQRNDDRSNIWRTLYRVPGFDEKRGPATIEIPIRTTGSGFLSGQVQIEGVEGSFNFIIDTGASISVVGESLFQREAFKQFVSRDPLRVYGAAGVTENVTALLLPRIRLGPHQSENVSAAVLDLDIVNETTGFEQMGILGGNFLRNYRVTFDFPRGYIVLEPIRPAPSGGESSGGSAGPPQT
jgi:predicted aspartyl protease/Flp pilus assembly protein TadD